MKKEETIEISIKKLEIIAKYYEFPMAAFFMNIKDLKKLKGTRNDSLFKKAEALDKIKEIVEIVK